MLKVGQTIETTSEKYNMLWLVKKGNEYGVLVHIMENGKSAGWFFGKTGSLKACREYAAHMRWGY